MYEALAERQNLSLIVTLIVSVGSLWLILGTHLCSRHYSHGLRQVRPSANDLWQISSPTFDKSNFLEDSVAPLRTSRDYYELSLMVSTLNSLVNCCGHESLSRSIVRFSVLVTSVCVVDVLQSSQSCSSKQRKAHPYSTTDNLVINKNKTTQNTLASIKEENTAVFLTRLVFRRKPKNEHLQICVGKKKSWLKLVPEFKSWYKA